MDRPGHLITVALGRRARALAEDADAGPWGQTDYYDEDDGCVCHLVHSGDADQFRVALGLQEYNAAFIAAANPAVVLGLLDDRDALLDRLAIAVCLLVLTLTPKADR